MNDLRSACTVMCAGIAIWMTPALAANVFSEKPFFVANVQREGVDHYSAFSRCSCLKIVGNGPWTDAIVMRQPNGEVVRLKVIFGGRNGPSLVITSPATPFERGLFEKHFIL